MPIVDAVLPASMRCARVITGGVVRTMAGVTAEAVAFDRTGILAVGRRDEVLAIAGAGAEVTDATGRAILPGFIDAHQHMSLAAVYEGCVDLAPARTIAEVAALVREAAAATPPGEWVLGHGYDDALLAERRHPTRDELDAASPERPVCLMHYSFHECVASSRALALAGVDRATADPFGGAITRDRRGQPTGHLVEEAMTGVEAMARASRVVRDADGWLGKLRAYQARLFAAGITRVVDAMVPPALEALYRRARDEGHLRVPVLMLPASEQGLLLRPHDRIASGTRSGDGDDALRTGPLKLVLDGANRCAVCLSLGRALQTGARTLGSAVAHLSTAGLRTLRATAPKLDRGLAMRTGVLFYDDDAARAIARRAHDAGLDLAIHAQGNAAIAQAVSALGAVRPRGPWPRRIEHGTFLDGDLVRRVADAGIAIVMQPQFLSLPALEDATIPSGLVYLRARSLLASGVCVAASSDAPVTGFDVLAGVRAAVTRRRRNGRALHPEEAVDVETALAMYTREAARASGCLDVTGTIEPGKRADLVVLGADPCADGVDLASVRVDETILGGETVYADDARARAVA